MSERTNKLKSEKLGMSFSTANQRLRKSIIFNLMKRCGLDTCNRCGNKMSLENFSIDHIEDWLYSDNPIEKFFNFENITFSHHKCNVDARDKTRGRANVGDSGFKGVYKFKDKYRARIWIEGKGYSLGYFDKPEDGARAYDARAKEEFGDKAVTNESLGLL